MQLLHRPNPLAPFVAVLLFPALALANVGTPLMWAGFFHLFIGNSLIGVFEGLLLAKFFKTSSKKSVLLLILANYASAWLGALLLPYMTNHVSLTIENVKLWLLIFILVAFLITVIVEFPFFLFAVTPRVGRRAVKATFSIHGISYLLLIAWYWSASGISLVTKVDLVAVEKMGLPQGYSLYYISPDGKTVVESDLTGKEQKVVATVDSRSEFDRLGIDSRSEHEHDLTLVKCDDYTYSDTQTIIRDFASLVPMDGRGKSAEYPRETVFNINPIPKLAVEGDWAYELGWWASDGIRGWNKPDNSKFHYALETPFCAWRIKNATHLEGNFAVFQLGDDQICILQPQERRMALVARGRGPIVVKGKSPVS